MKKIVSLLLSLVMMISVFAGFGVTANAAQKGTWQKDNTGWRYSLSNGSYYKDIKVSIDGQTYYFNEEGYMITGWRYIANDWYYFNGAGFMQTGWQHIGKCDYFFYKDGIMATDCFPDYNNEDYFLCYVDENGVWIPNKWMKDSKGWWYLLGDGSYLKDDGVLINGKGYIFDKNGYMMTGWFGDDYGSIVWWYYLTENGALDGWQYINGDWYYFYDYVMITDWEEINDDVFYFDESGKMITGWRFIDDDWFYFNGAGYMQTGWQYINGKYYYFYDYGDMAHDERVDGFYVDANGVWVPGA